MLVVSRNFLALNILIEICDRPTGIATTKELAEALAIPLPYTRKITNQLIKAGFLNNLRGCLGGVMLAHKPHDIRIGDIVSAIEALRMPTRDGPASPGELADLVQDAGKKFIEVLNEHSLADLRKARRHPKSRDKPALSAPSRLADGNRLTVRKSA